MLTMSEAAWLAPARGVTADCWAGPVGELAELVAGAGLGRAEELATWVAGALVAAVGFGDGLGEADRLIAGPRLVFGATLAVEAEGEGASLPGKATPTGNG